MRVRGYDTGLRLWRLLSKRLLRPLRNPVMFVWHRAVLRYEMRDAPNAPWRRL